MTQTKGDKLLVILLRYCMGCPALFAIIAVFMPFSWMVATHRRLGLGEMPTGAVVEYLARALSVAAVLLGALCIVLASDLERYRPLVRFFGLAMGLMGLVFTGIDAIAGLPWWWVAFEGPPGVVLGPLMYYLARPRYHR